MLLIIVTHVFHPDTVTFVESHEIMVRIFVRKIDNLNDLVLRNLFSIHL